MELKQNLQRNNRIAYFDYLRVFATFAVIMLHTAAQGWKEADVHTFQWQVKNVYDCIAFWGVPIFVMISGALFLSREKIDIKRLYSKNISRLAAAYFFWSFIYAFEGPFVSGSKLLLKSIPVDILISSFHLWFVPMIIGLYICLPFIHKITQSEELIKYFLILAFVFGFAFPQIKTMSEDLFGGIVSEIIKALNSIVFNMRMDMVLGFTFFFILGYVLARTDISPKQRKIIYALGILGVIMAIVLNIAASFRNNKPLSTYGGNFTVNAVFISSAIFVWFKYNIKGTGRLDGIIQKMSKYSFGTYLVHIAVMEFLDKFGFNSMMFNPVLAIPAVFVSVAVISFLISAVINKIPFLNKWIV